MSWESSCLAALAGQRCKAESGTQHLGCVGEIVTFSLSKERASTTAAMSVGRLADTLLAQGGAMMGTRLFWLEIECTKRGSPAFMRNSVYSCYRHLVAILKEDKETFGFEIQVRLK